MPTIEELKALETASHNAQPRIAIALELLTRANGLKPQEVLRIADHLLGNHGIEVIRHPVNGMADVLLEYSNTGDSYALTLAWEPKEEIFLVTSWGDFYENWELEHVLRVPTPVEISNELRLIALSIHGIDGCEKDDEGRNCTDVRLQLHKGWSVKSGSSDYDQDHRGYWGGASVSTGMTEDEHLAVAQALLDQAVEAAAEDDKVCQFEDGRYL